MQLSPDEIIFWQYGFFQLNATLVFTWAVMLVLVAGAELHHAQRFRRPETRPLAKSARNHRHRHRETNRRGRARHPRKAIGFLATLFLLLAMSALGTIFPG